MSGMRLGALIKYGNLLCAMLVLAGCAHGRQELTSDTDDMGDGFAAMLTSYAELRGACAEDGKAPQVSWVKDVDSAMVLVRRAFAEDGGLKETNDIDTIKRLIRDGKAGVFVCEIEDELRFWFVRFYPEDAFRLQYRGFNCTVDKGRDRIFLFSGDCFYDAITKESATEDDDEH